MNNEQPEIELNLSLKNLLEDYLVLPEKYNRIIYGLALDSRQIKPGFLFFAYPGYKEDGRDYIDAAILNGAIAILCEGPEAQVENLPTKNSQNIPIIYLPKLSEITGPLAAKFYKYPSQKMTVIGVTGTNGKTSITHFIAASLEALHKKCGIIGTLGTGFLNNLSPSELTTPDPISLQNKFAYFLRQKTNIVAMEVSSARLAQNRLQGVNFNIAIFTNLTRDHLDYHKDMESYAKAKRSLFLYPGLAFAIINVDDPYGQNLLTDLPISVKPFAYTVSDIKTTVPTTRAKNIELKDNGFKAEIETPWGNTILQSQLFGRFNLSNLLASLTTLCIMGIDLKEAANVLERVKSVTGRMQVLGGNNLPRVVIDYAHTPDALEKTLLALREHCLGELWCVFGAGGDRDTGKRPIMGKIAERYSDQIIITSDNPRCEDPQKIIEDILQGLLCPWAAEVEENREVAIYHAIDCAKANDVVLIAGKGHEDYQIIGKNKYPFSDLEKAKEALLRKKRD